MSSYASFSNRGCPKNELSRLSIELAEAHEAGAVNWGETPKVWVFFRICRQKIGIGMQLCFIFCKVAQKLVGKLTGIPDFDDFECIVTRNKIEK